MMRNMDHPDWMLDAPARQSYRACMVRTPMGCAMEINFTGGQDPDTKGKSALYHADKETRVTRRYIDGVVLKEIEEEMGKAARAFETEDKTNTAQDFINYSLAYIGRATSAQRNDAEISYGRIKSRREMMIKAIGLLIRAAEELR